VYEDNISRCFVIAIDESVIQTKNIIAYQNKIASGKVDINEQKKVTTFILVCIKT